MTNSILASLQKADRDRILSRLEHVTLARQHILFESGQPIDHIYFPETCVVSLIIELPDGREVEGAMIGREGVAGIGGLNAKNTSYTRQQIQVAGSAHRASRAVLRELETEFPDVEHVVAAYRDAFAALLLQTIACQSVHTAEERLARNLLETIDRSGTLDVPITHEILGIMVGVGRPTITLLVRAFEAAQLVRTRRGGMTILDKPGLQEISCPCYELARQVFVRAGLFPHVPDAD